MFLCLVRDSLSPSLPGVLESVARACSPRVEPHGDDVVMCDARGLTRVIGEPVVIADEMRRMAWDRGMGVRVAIAGTHTAAWLLAHVRPGTTVVAPGDEANVLSRLPVTALSMLPESSGGIREVLATLDRWGVATLGDLARLPRAEIASRLGVAGARLHQAARGEDAIPLVPAGEPVRFLERVELEWPVEGLEPLSFVLARLCEALSGALERADRGAVAIITRLTLVNRSVHERTLTLPAPMRDAKVLRTLILLDLEAHPPQGDPEHGYGAGIDVVELELRVTPGRIIQKSLLAHDVPAVEDAATLVARLQALMGESRVGSPVVLDTHDPRKSSLKPFVAPSSSPSSLGPVASPRDGGPSPGRVAIRRFRLPVAAQVSLESGSPVRMQVSSRMLRGGVVIHRAGPWRTSGHWWTADRDTWDRDEWDVELDSGVIYRLARDRATDRWEVEGVID